MNRKKFLVNYRRTTITRIISGLLAFVILSKKALDAMFTAYLYFQGDIKENNTTYYEFFLHISLPAMIGVACYLIRACLLTRCCTLEKKYIEFLNLNTTEEAEQYFEKLKLITYYPDKDTEKESMIERMLIENYLKNSDKGEEYEKKI